MRNKNWIAQALVASVVALAFATGVAAQSVTSSVISNIDLSKPFSTPEAWRFIATQGPPVDGLYDKKEPGQIQLCLRAASSASCDPQMLNALGDASSTDASFTQPHYLNATWRLRILEVCR